jgi:hypothetical protein
MMNAITPPPAFEEAVTSLRAARIRSELAIQEAPAPGRLAPFSLAVNADVILPDDRDRDIATGRFVLLHDPASPEAWRGTFRCVTFVRAELEPEMTSDPLLTAVGWSWLLESLADRGATWECASGTATRIVSESFGELATRPPTAEIEIRASWTPIGSVGLHFEAWCDLLATCAGLMPLPEGVSQFGGRSGSSS